MFIRRVLLAAFLATACVTGCTPVSVPTNDPGGQMPDPDDVPNDPADPDVNDDPAMDPAGPTEPQAGADALPDFSVEDVNPGSPRFTQQVSPRDYLGQVSAWYFGHST